MKADSIFFFNYRCFGYPDKIAGFSSIKPINLIIGKNNSGKSHLLRLVEWMCSGDILQRGSENPEARKCNYRFQGVLDEETLKKLSMSRCQNRKTKRPGVEYDLSFERDFVSTSCGRTEYSP